MTEIPWLNVELGIQSFVRSSAKLAGRWESGRGREEKEEA